MTIKSITASAVVLAALPTAQAMTTITTGNLITDPGFEVQSTIPSFAGAVGNFTANQGLWGAENGNFTATVGGVNPLGTKMHGMNASGAWSQTIQITDLSPWATEIAAGNATFNMSAVYNASSDIPAAIGQIGAYFFTSNWNSRFDHSTNSETLDDNTRTWEFVSHGGDIPSNATWMGTELVYISDSLDGSTGFVDQASLTITTTSVPEPSSIFLVALSTIGVISRRKRS